MVLEAQKFGCVREVMIITAGLSIQDPRERPADKKQASDEKHRRFADKDSDFLAYVNLWNYLAGAAESAVRECFPPPVQKRFP
ncbi:ATP-dependent RNA helicase HrpA [Pantoea agglomerans]|uniref:ATP-dependent RNA helicase HrpA n=1 Tax=Enterobacter agglomerans TaxID=549 RepID=A0A379AFK1_ENTAG|nr:ATP-dependent RNA helicase HrpA [Pantoea agglomerans]